MDRDLASLSDIRRVATELMAMREKYALDAVLADDVLTSAVLHKAIVMGEAANRVSAAGRAKWALPWREMTGMRNVLVHDYDGVDLSIVWIRQSPGTCPAAQGLENGRRWIRIVARHPAEKSRRVEGLTNEGS